MFSFILLFQFQYYLLRLVLVNAKKIQEYVSLWGYSIAIPANNYIFYAMQTIT